jgi:hypothetical protein
VVRNRWGCRNGGPYPAQAGQGVEAHVSRPGNLRCPLGGQQHLEFLLDHQDSIEVLGERSRSEASSMSSVCSARSCAAVERWRACTRVSGCCDGVVSQRMRKGEDGRRAGRLAEDSPVRLGVTGDSRNRLVVA